MDGETSVVVAVRTESFAEEVVGARVPVVVHFGDPGSAAGLAMAGVLEELGREYAGRVRFARVNLEEEAGLGAAFGIRRGPALLYYEAGAPRELWSGAPEGAAVRGWIEGHLGRGGEAVALA